MSLAQAMATTFGTYCVADFLSNFLQVSFIFFFLWITFLFVSLILSSVLYFSLTCDEFFWAYDSIFYAFEKSFSRLDDQSILIVTARPDA